ncbi:MAG: hypothetical protein Q7J10_00805 [Methanosarcinaceae archaeon]|nr:hypothetical protein [Methanosarcinaceae archaeon]
MDEIIRLINGIDSNVLTSSDVSFFVDILKKRSHVGIPGMEKVSKDDIQWFETYAFTLKKVELLNEGGLYDIERGGDWRQALDDFSKLRFLVDELEEKELVNDVFWHVEGIVLYNITNPDIYRRYLYAKIKNHLEKIKK